MALAKLFQRAHELSALWGDSRTHKIDSISSQRRLRMTIGIYFAHSMCASQRMEVANVQSITYIRASLLLKGAIPFARNNNLCRRSLAREAARMRRPARSQPGRASWPPGANICASMCGPLAASSPIVQFQSSNCERHSHLGTSQLSRGSSEQERKSIMS